MRKLINLIITFENVRLSKQIDESKLESDAIIERLSSRIAVLEGKIHSLESLPAKVTDLTERVEERTNRQLRETLVFRNFPESSPDETYAQIKQLLAEQISEHCGIPFDDVNNQIKRAHRESKSKIRENDYRKGKRHIFAAFHSWELCQSILEKFRLKCIQNSDFKLAADQKYGPLTTKRRYLALQKRIRSLKHLVRLPVDL